LATQMLGYWTHFARTGDPNSAGAPPWPAYDTTKDSYLELQTPIAARDGLHTAACDLLDSLAPTQPEQGD
jgi:para-nitrobenzyl esterase